jgi:hypothetical protein
MHTKFSSTASDGSTVTYYTHEGPGGPTSTTYQDHEKHLLAFPGLLTGENLLNIAETRSNQQLSDDVTAARKSADGPLLSSAQVAIRITAALQSRAEEIGITLQQAQSAYTAIRKGNGVLSIRLVFRTKEKTHAALVFRTKEKTATTVENSATADASDSELSEFETDTEQ